MIKDNLSAFEFKWNATHTIIIMPIKFAKKVESNVCLPTKNLMLTIERSITVILLIVSIRSF